MTRRIENNEIRGILAIQREEGYRAGFSQASMVAYDDAFERGREQERAASRALLRRWLAIFAVTLILEGWLFYTLGGQ